jgi:predicted dinucleotide-binding enzyme
MQLAMIGLGRMGASMVRRLIAKGHECVVHDMRPAAVAALQKEGAIGAASLAELAAKTTRPRAIWLMVPAAAVDAELEQLKPHLDAGDVVVDGGNSYLCEDFSDEEEPYERLPGDAVAGDRSLFTSQDAVEAAWAVVDRVLVDHSPCLPYAPASWGPAAAEALTAGDGGWHDPTPEKRPAPCPP